MTILAILAGIIILSIILLVHEFGHFFAAKITGVKVEEFGLGFPPKAVKLFSWGETLFTLNWIPFGGFNKILGEDEKSKDPRAFCNKSAGVRFFIASGGILANLIFAWILLTVWFWILPYIQIPNYVAIIQVDPGSPAQVADLKPNDLIVQIDNTKLQTPELVSEYTQNHKGQEINLEIKRQGKIIDKKIVLGNSEHPLGVAMSETGNEKVAIKWYQAPYLALKEMWAVTYLTFYYVGQFFVGLFHKTKTAGFELSGPVGIVASISQIAYLSWLLLIRVAALISLGLGLFNILPIPAVDGGRLFFIGMEKIFGKKVIRSEHENAIHAVGFIILIILSLLIVYLDVRRILG